MLGMLRMKCDLQDMGVSLTAAAALHELSHFELSTFDAENVGWLLVM
jgi:hypothetical protein